MIIAFCTPCMNRRWQLEQTLPENLAVLRGTPHLLAVCDYNSRDGLPELVSAYGDDVRTGTLHYFRTTEPSEFHVGRAKNTAHRVALRRAPDVLFNLDADNYVTDATLRLVEEVFAREPEALLYNWSGDWLSGSEGRIALSAASWTRLGGYDETFFGMAWQDIDLLLRARSLGIACHVRSEGIRPAIPNNLEQKLENLPSARARPGTPREQFMALNSDNLVQSMGRPLRLPVDEQQRFSGELNYGGTVTV